MRQNGTRKRPASAISTSGFDQVQEVRNQAPNSSSPRMMENPSQMRMQSPQIPFSGLPDYADPTNIYANGLNGSPYYNSPQPQTQPGSLGTELVRAQLNNQMVPVADYTDGYPMARPEFSGPPVSAENELQGQGQGHRDDLDHRALLAQRDAQAKRKQIPPFVQKLSSFLDENTRNTDLIRWSESGDSFIVVDEDEFAKTLIPELFKHNNYASFVRQLNMYGFHKKVGLSDNSMRASERKNKNPSEYSNPYFKRGRPNLLWLIHKPKNAPSKGGSKNTKAKQEDAEEDADELFARDSPVPPIQEQVEGSQNPWSGRQPLALPPADGKLPPEQFESLQNEMAEIRHQQSRIANMLNMTRREHAHLYSQAKAFHELHEKHDNSINAILTFLATVYNKNMDKGVDFNDMFGPNTLPPRDDGRDIIDVGDEKHSPVSDTSRPLYAKKKPLLLKDKASAVNSADSAEPPKQWSASRFSYPEKPKGSPFQPPATQEIHLAPSNRGSQSPPINAAKAAQDAMSWPNASETGDILSVIQNQNAKNNKLNETKMEFPEALSHLQNSDGQSPLTPSQRQNMLQLMSNEQANSPQNGNYNKALTSYSPPNPAANLAQFNLNSEQLSQIEQSLREQEARMASMQATIAPLSPSGSIPGINDQSYNNPNPELDLDSIFNSGDYFNDGSDPAAFDFTNGGADLPDFDFSTGVDPVNGDPFGQGPAQFDGVDEGRVKEMGSSEGASPAATVHTIDSEAHIEGSPKKRKKSN